MTAVHRCPHAGKHSLMASCPCGYKAESRRCPTCGDARPLLPRLLPPHRSEDRMTWHKHRWTAWSDPTSDGWGRSFQLRRCKDRDCNKHQRRDCQR